MPFGNRPRPVVPRRKIKNTVFDFLVKHFTGRFGSLNQQQRSFLAVKAAVRGIASMKPKNQGKRKIFTQRELIEFEQKLKLPK